MDKSQVTGICVIIQNPGKVFHNLVTYRTEHIHQLLASVKFIDMVNEIATIVGIAQHHGMIRLFKMDGGVVNERIVIDGIADEP